jgi:hypothetical protein
LNEIRIYPNPATDEVTISSDKPFSKIEIYSVTGELIKQLSNIAENLVKISIGDYTSGMYFIKIFQEENRITKKLVDRRRMESLRAMLCFS